MEFATLDNAFAPVPFQIGVPEIFKWSIGDTTGRIEGGWQGIVAIDYAAGWFAIDTRYRWTREERLAIGGWAHRAWLRAVGR